jgi:hypothetical protein
MKALFLVNFNIIFSTKRPFSSDNGPSPKDFKPEFTITDLTDLKKLESYRPLLKGKQGVYAFLNTKNGKQYIGSAQDLYMRLLEHIKGNKSKVGALGGGIKIPPPSAPNLIRFLKPSPT